MSEGTAETMPRRKGGRARVSLAGVISFAGLVALGVARNAAANEPDPTRPPDATDLVAMAIDTGPEGFDLRAILFASGRRIAIVNGRRVIEGDTVADARVERIDARKVRLVRASETIELELGPPDVKRRHDAANDPEVYLGPPAVGANRRGGMAGPMTGAASQEGKPR